MILFGSISATVKSLRVIVIVATATGQRLSTSETVHFTVLGLSYPGVFTVSFYVFIGGVKAPTLSADHKPV